MAKSEGIVRFLPCLTHYRYMETPTLFCAATGLMAVIIIPSLKKIAKLFKRSKQWEAVTMPCLLSFNRIN